MEIVYGTKNIGKLNFMRQCLKSLYKEYGLELTDLNTIGASFADVEEDGAAPLDNARTKALAYYKILRRPVFSLDSGLYFDGLPDSLQPGVNVRRVNGKRLTDDEMIDYYSRLAKNNGGKLVGRYKNGICLVADDNLIFEHDGEDIATEKFLIVPTPHKKRVEGFPLDSLSVNIKTNEYYYDQINDNNEAWHTENGFHKFFKSAISTICPPYYNKTSPASC